MIFFGISKTALIHIYNFLCIFLTILLFSVAVVEKRGNQLVVPCIITEDHNDLERLQWLKDGEQIAQLTIIKKPEGGTENKIAANKDSSSLIRVDENDFSLHILKSKMEHSGMYTCLGLPSLNMNGTQPVLFEEVTQVIINGEFTYIITRTGEWGIPCGDHVNSFGQVKYHYTKQFT